MSMDYLKHKAKVEAVIAAENAGEVADSLDVRKALLIRMHAGELTLEQVQAEIARLKRTAKRNGKTTRDAVYRHN